MANSVVTAYRILLNKPELSGRGFRAVFLTDLHNCSWGYENKNLIREIDDLSPDVVLCGGDMIVAYPGEDVSESARLIRRLSKKYPVYYSMGNHEYRMWLYPDVYDRMFEEYMSYFADTSVKFLVNAKTQLTIRDCPVTLYGLNIPRQYYQRLKRTDLPISFLQEKLGEADTESVSVLMAHTPSYMNTYLQWGADLTLCGHYHGGVITMPDGRGVVSPELIPFKSIAHGKVELDGHYGIVSAGLGEHTLKLRIHNPRELVALDVICK